MDAVPDVGRVVGARRQVRALVRARKRVLWADSFVRLPDLLDLQSFKYMHFFEERFREFEKELQPKKCPVRFDNSRRRLF